MTSLPPVIVISLKESTERRKIMAAALEKLGLTYSFFDAIQGSALDLETLPDYAGLKRRLFFGRDLTRGEVGCILSHRAVLKKIADEKIPNALILEDDARLEDDAPAVLQTLMTMGKNWDIVRFLFRAKTLKASRKVCDLVNGYSLTRVFGTPGGAYAYLVTEKAATALVPFLQKNWQPNDVLLGQTWRTGLDVYAVSPSPIVADDDIASTIGEERFRKTKKLHGWEKIAYPFTRGAYKLWENAGKYYGWCRDWIRG